MNKARPNLTREAFKNLRQIGSLVESSPYLSKKLLKGIDFSKPVHIVELGGGNGAVTRSILNAISPNSKVSTVEIHPEFVKHLRSIEDNRLEVLNECISKNQSIAEQSVDAVISCLPIANFDTAKKTELLTKVKALLKPAGQFRQFQYSLLDYGQVKASFGNMQLDYCLFNIPPAFVYKSINL